MKLANYQPCSNYWNSLNFSAENSFYQEFLKETGRTIILKKSPQCVFNWPKHLFFTSIILSPPLFPFPGKNKVLQRLDYNEHHQSERERERKRYIFSVCVIFPTEMSKLIKDFLYPYKYRCDCTADVTIRIVRDCLKSTFTFFSKLMYYVNCCFNYFGAILRILQKGMLYKSMGTALSCLKSFLNRKVYHFPANLGMLLWNTCNIYIYICIY